MSNEKEYDPALDDELAALSAEEKNLETEISKIRQQVRPLDERVSKLRAKKFDLLNIYDDKFGPCDCPVCGGKCEVNVYPGGGDEGWVRCSDCEGTGRKSKKSAWKGSRMVVERGLNG